jgi:hypothetical protein
MPEITFGKFKGREMSDPEVPTSYLEWLYGVTVNTAAEIQAELARREQAETGNVPLAERMVTAGYHALCENCDDGDALQELAGTHAALEKVVAHYLKDQAQVEETRRMDAASEKRRQILKWKHGS